MEDIDLDESIEIDQSFDDENDTPTLSGGATKELKKKYYPVKTGNIISRFELCRVITKLAKYLDSLADLSSLFTNDEQSKELLVMPNPTELAWRLLKEGKFDPIICRRGEKVSFSVLEIDPEIVDMIEHDFEQQRAEVAKLMKLWHFDVSES